VKVTSWLVALVVAVLGAIALATGWKATPLPATPSAISNPDIPLGAAKSASVAIEMGVGQLTVRGGASGLVQGRLEISPPRMQPIIDVSNDTTRGAVTIHQPEPRALGFGDFNNDWALNLGDGVPIDLTVKTGAGQASLDLRGLDLTSLRVVTGAGDTDVDLSGPRTRDLRARVDHGVGQLTVRLPRDVPVRVSNDTGFNIDAPGFVVRGGFLVNDAYLRSSSGHTVDVALTRGVGDVQLSLVP
jgi:hypothetical protein